MPKVVSVKIENDHTDQIIAAMRDKVQLALKSIGQEAEGYAKDDCPVDTGRLRNSITCATIDYHSSGNDRLGQNASAEDMAMRAVPEEGSVYIGTNVKYGVYVEYGDYTHESGKRHFLRDAAAEHGDHYKAIMEAALKS